MSTALQHINRDDWQVMREQAEVLIKSGFLPQSIKSAENAVAIILQGRELGIGAMAALQTINVIQGKPTVSPQLMLALINRSGQLEDMKMEADSKGATCLMKRKGRSPHTVNFGEAEARAMNLLGKDNYKKQAATMYQWRAVAACARVVFPDIILGLYTPDEMGADVTVTDDGAMEVAPVIETQPEARAISETVPSREAVDEGVERSELIHQIRQECVGLGYDEAKIEQAVSRALAMSTGKMLAALGSLKKLRDKKQIESKRKEVCHIFDEHGWDENDIERYLTSEHGGIPLEEMNLDQLVAICDDLAGVAR